MKRITILRRTKTVRDKGYFKDIDEVIELKDYTDLQIKRRLEELNKNKRSRKYEIFQDFKLNTKKGQYLFELYQLNKKYNIKQQPATKTIVKRETELEKELIFLKNSLGFAFDGCHKIYILEDAEDLKDAKNMGYLIKSIEELPKVWTNSCELKFVNNWKLDKTIIAQFESAKISIM